MHALEKQISPVPTRPAQPLGSPGWRATSLAAPCPAHPAVTLLPLQDRQAASACRAPRPTAWSSVSAPRASSASATCWAIGITASSLEHCGRSGKCGRASVGRANPTRNTAWEQQLDQISLGAGRATGERQRKAAAKHQGTRARGAAAGVWPPCAGRAVCRTLHCASCAPPVCLYSCSSPVRQASALRTTCGGSGRRAALGWARLQ